MFRMPHLVSYHVFIAPRVLGLELKHARVTVQKLSTLSGRQARPWLRLHREDVDENQTRESTVYMYILQVWTYQYHRQVE